MEKLLVQRVVEALEFGDFFLQLSDFVVLLSELVLHLVVLLEEEKDLILQPLAFQSFFLTQLGEFRSVMVELLFEVEIDLGEGTQLV